MLSVYANVSSDGNAKRKSYQKCLKFNREQAKLRSMKEIFAQIFTREFRTVAKNLAIICKHLDDN